MHRLSALCLPAALLTIGCGRATPVEEITAAAGAISDQQISVGDDSWPRWRGSDQDGIATAENPPQEWSESENILWRTPVPGRGHSSPVVTEASIYLTTADERAEEQSVVCFDRQHGEQQWSTTIHSGGFMGAHPKNSRASATPAWDGEHLYTAFINSGALWVTAVDAQGEVVWQKEAGPFGAEHGYGSSPALYKSLVIVCGDNADSSFVAALDRSTGDLVWRTARERPGRHGSYGSPVVVEMAGLPQLLLMGLGKLTSYDPETGALIWHCYGPAEVAACTVACSDELVFASGGYPEKEILAVRADGSGDVGESHVAWRGSKGVTYVPSPIYHDGYLYIVNDRGIASCIDAASGKAEWTKRLGGEFSASPVLAGENLFAVSEAGTTYVFRASPQYELVAENQLGDGSLASPAICGGQIFLRTDGELCCIGAL